MSKQKTKKFRKVSKKNKCYTKEEVEFITQVRSIKLIYLDNPLLGFKSDEEDKKKCGEDFLRWVKYQRIETVISFINIYELRPLFIGKIIKVHPQLAKNTLSVLQEYNPSVISEKDTVRLAKEYKSFWLFLTKNLKLSDADAAHFVMAVGSGSDLFVSFNKRAFQKYHKKIGNKLQLMNKPMPRIWTLEDIKEKMRIYHEIMIK